MPSIRRPIKTADGDLVKFPAYRVDFEEAKEIAEIWLVMADLQFVGMATKKLLKLQNGGEMDEVAIRCLWTGAIEAYARCFATGRRFRLDKAQVFAGQPAELNDHDQALTLRNEHTAHPVMDLEKGGAGILITDEGDWKVALLGTFGNAPPPDVVRALGQTSEIVWNWVKQKLLVVEHELLTKAKALGEETIKSYPQIEMKTGIWGDV